MILRSKISCALFLFCVSIHAVLAQDSKLVQILNADQLRILNQEGSEIKQLVGNVRLIHEGTNMECDSAIILPNNDVHAVGHVHLLKENTNTYSDFLFYSSAEQLATLSQNATVSDPQITIKSNELFYNLKTDIGYYNNGGTVNTKDTKVTSTKAVYYKNTEDVHFQENVVVANPQFTLENDLLKYNLSTRKVFYEGPTNIFNPETHIWCKKGSYDLAAETATFSTQTIIQNPPQWLMSDSLFYDKKKNYGRAFIHFYFLDTALKMQMVGTEAEYFGENQHIIGYKRPLLKNAIGENDTLYIRAERLETLAADTIENHRSFFAYQKVRLYKPDLQAVSDTLIYTYVDSTFRLYGTPAIWTDSSQLTADTVLLYKNQNEITKIEQRRKAYLLDHKMAILYDQIKADFMETMLTDNKPVKLFAINNAESIYWGKEEGKGYMGANISKSQKIRATFKDAKIDKINFIGKPSAIFKPINKLTPDDYQLQGFKWRSAERPKHAKDL